METLKQLSLELSWLALEGHFFEVIYRSLQKLSKYP